MCGICGIYNIRRVANAEKRLIAMRDVMWERGPDAAGLYLNEQIGFGHRRLSIIDLSANANQPMHNSAHTVSIVFNGEIYNFRELRETLQQRGRQFVTASDTEVLLHGYEVWGIDGLLTRLNGMFAFGLWDATSQKLILARDRLGVKPLFYCLDNGSIYFASDIKAIVEALPQELAVDETAVDRLLHSYCLPQTMSLYAGIEKVLPANFVTIDASGVAVKRYWQPDFREKLDISEPEWLEQIEAGLRAAVKRRLISDVPLGAFLSGGVDSGMVVAMMALEMDSPVRTFSIGFYENRFNELPFAGHIASRYGTRHEEIMLKPEVRRDLLRILWGYGEAFADSSAVPTFYVSQAARQHVTVILSGDGGDEAFGGYSTVNAMFASQQWLGWLPDFGIEGLAALAPLADKLPIAPLRKMMTLLAYQRLARRNRGWERRALFSPALKAALYTPRFREKLSAAQAWRYEQTIFASTAGADPTDRMLQHDYLTLLPDDFLAKVDVASMLNSLEVRSPFLDYTLVELLARVPASIKLQQRQPKYLLKKIAEKYLPAENIYKPKSGFEIPVGNWLRGEWARLVQRLLLDERAQTRRFFQPETVRWLLETHRTGQRDFTHQIWTLLILELWFRLFIDKSLQKDDVLEV